MGLYCALDAKSLKDKILNFHLAFFFLPKFEILPEWDVLQRGKYQGDENSNF